jgi:hypothetical protein
MQNLLRDCFTVFAQKHSHERLQRNWAPLWLKWSYYMVLHFPYVCGPGTALQHDNHLPVLTVGETLEFAHACAGARPDFISKEELADV